VDEKSPWANPFTTAAAAASERTYWAALKAAFHSGFRRKTSAMIEPVAWAITAGRAPAVSNRARANVVEVVIWSSSP